MTNLSMVNVEEFWDEVEITNLCSVVGSEQLEGYSVMFTVEASNKEGTKETFICFWQTLERLDSLRAYSGYEMRRGSFYGCDADETDELEEFLGYSDNVEAVLKENAEKLAKSCFDQLRLTEEEYTEAQLSGEVV